MAHVQDRRARDYHAACGPSIGGEVVAIVEVYLGLVCRKAKVPYPVAQLWSQVVNGWHC